ARRANRSRRRVIPISEARVPPAGAPRRGVRPRYLSSSIALCTPGRITKASLPNSPWTAWGDGSIKAGRRDGRDIPARRPASSERDLHADEEAAAELVVPGAPGRRRGRRQLRRVLEVHEAAIGRVRAARQR